MMRLTCAAFLIALPAMAQSEAPRLHAALAEEVLAPQTAVFQLRDYVLKRVAKPPAPRSAEEWSAESKRLRARMMEIVYHGWPKEWVESAPKFEEAGVIAGKGYRIRKLRYEIVPGFYSTALLYEPENLHGKVPAILNVNGHADAEGKAVEYKQKRCITFARNGALALSLEWLNCGELMRKENEHSNGGHLELAGAHSAGLFYLAMRRGLDYLYEHANTDRARLGMTGLSGGGWQTITLSSLDERVRAAVPVAGFSSLSTRVEMGPLGDVGDIEQAATDMFDGADFTHLVALMAPRPLLLAHNAEDDCCFRGPAVRPLTFDGMRPVYRLFGKETSLEYHENARSRHAQLSARQSHGRISILLAGVRDAGGGKRGRGVGSAQLRRTGSGVAEGQPDDSGPGAEARERDRASTARRCGGGAGWGA